MNRNERQGRDARSDLPPFLASGWAFAGIIFYKAGTVSSVGPNSDETVSSVGPNSGERLAPAQKCKKCGVLPYSNTVGGTAGGTVAEYG